MALFNKSKSSQPQMSMEEKCTVLGGLWLNFSDEAQQNEAWSAFFDHNDVALPLSYMVAEELVLGLTDEAMALIEETWTSFCEYLDVDPQGHYSSVVDAFEASPNAPLELAEPTTSASDRYSNDHGLEGFMGRSAPDSGRYSNDHGLEGFMGRSAPDSPHIADDLPVINVTKGAWREIQKFSRSNGMREARMRLYILPCECRGYQWGIYCEDQWSADDLVLREGKEFLVLDPVSVKNSRGTRLNSEGRGNGDFVLSLPYLDFCSCGDNWQPTMAVAAAAVTFGIVKRNIAIANGWLDENSAQAESAGSYSENYSDSSEGDFDYGFDFGGF